MDCKGNGSNAQLTKAGCEVIKEKRRTDRLEVETPLGTLIASVSPDPNYPGIYIDLKRDGCPYEAAVALAECMPAEDGKPGYIMCRTWGDAMQEDYTHAEEIRSLDEFFEIPEGMEQA